MSYYPHPELLSHLAQWQGYEAQVWDYTIGHGVLRIKIQRTPGYECVILMLKDCTKVTFATDWDNANIVVQTIAGPFEPRFLVIDSDRLQVVCGAVFLSETYDNYEHIPISWASD